MCTPTFEALFVLNFKTKYCQRWYGDKLRQTMVDSWYWLDQVAPEGMNQVLRRSDARNHKQRTPIPSYLLTLLRESVLCPRALPNIFMPKQVRKTNSTCSWTSSTKRLENRFWCFEPKISLTSFLKGSYISKLGINVTFRREEEGWDRQVRTGRNQKSGSAVCKTSLACSMLGSPAAGSSEAHYDHECENNDIEHGHVKAQDSSRNEKRSRSLAVCSICYVHWSGANFCATDFFF